MRSIEYFSVGDELAMSFQEYATGIGLDFLLASFAIALFSIIQSIFFAIGFQFQRRIAIAWSLILIFLNFSLLQYVLVTKIPLDESIYLFSFKELQLILAGESRLSFSMVLELLVVFGVYLVILKRLSKLRWESKFNRLIGIVFIALLMFPSWICVDSQTDFQKAANTNNRLTFFVQRSIYFWNHQGDRQKSTVQLTDFAGLDFSFLGGESISSQFPLVHELPDSSEFANFFHTSKNGPPNIVFLIVESLSTTLVGERGDKTGNLLPFLDSLSQESLYWPNFLATCDRTNNVLPASLASVPYTTHGNMFQQVKFPAHWSLISLLNKNYFTRFYCGVDLNFANMNGYMNHYETDYLVNDWEPVFQQKYSHRSTPWGFSDGSLFEKSWLDFGKQKLSSQKRMDVFLTISTHDPFVVPNEDRYISRVKHAISKIKNPTSTHQYVLDHAREFASFVYVDDQLKAYFEKAKNQPGYENTIFFIFGDHGTELCLYDDLSRYKIPLIVYSPMLKQPQTFQAVSSQLDLAPTILNYLRLTYNQDLPSVVPFIGRELDYTKSYRNHRSLILGTNGLTDEHLFHAHHFLFHDKLYRVSKGLQIQEMKNDALKRQLSTQRKKANLLADYTIFGNRMLPQVIFEKYGKTKTLRVLKSFQKKQFSKQEITAEFIELGPSISLNPKTNAIQVEVTFEFWNDSDEKPASLPRFTCSLENEGGEVLFWKQMDYESLRFKLKSWNQLNVTMELNLNDYKRLKSKNTFKYYILNASKKPFKLRNLQTKIEAVD